MTKEIVKQYWILKNNHGYAILADDQNRIMEAKAKLDNFKIQHKIID